MSTTDWRAGCLLALLAGSVEPAIAADAVPACRLDSARSRIVADTVALALKAYADAGRSLPFTAAAINPAGDPEPGALPVRIVLDAAVGKTDAAGCRTATPAPTDSLDEISVAGGCVSLAARRELRCSAEAVKVFSDVGNRADVANPALLYVLGHELAHVIQGQGGKYSGAVETLDLGQPSESKLARLRDACEPQSTKREEEADSLSLTMLKDALARPPYREPLFSERGSLYWNIDQLALASETWRGMVVQRGEAGSRRLHLAFVPTTLPAPAATVEANARRFVCDALSRKKGVLEYPARSHTHPGLEQRLQKIAESLRPIALTLPESGGSQAFAPLARLQQSLSPIFTFMYREGGIYRTAIQDAICTRVNGPQPTADCGTPAGKKAR